MVGLVQHEQCRARRDSIETRLRVSEPRAERASHSTWDRGVLKLTNVVRGYRSGGQGVLGVAMLLKYYWGQW